MSSSCASFVQVIEPKVIPIYVHVDTETTGLDLVKHGIVQVSAYATGADENDLYGYFNQDANPFRDRRGNDTDIEWDQQAFDTNGFTLDRIYKAEPLDYVMEQFLKFLDGLTPVVSDSYTEYQVYLVFHNSQFDSPRLQLAAARAGIKIKYFRRVLCTISLGFAATGKVLSQQKLAENYGIVNRAPHDGFTDALTLSKNFHAIQRDLAKRKKPLTPITIDGGFGGSIAPLINPKPYGSTLFN